MSYTTNHVASNMDGHCILMAHMVFSDAGHQLVNNHDPHRLNNFSFRLFDARAHRHSHSVLGAILRRSTYSPGADFGTDISF